MHSLTIFCPHRPELQPHRTTRADPVCDCAESIVCKAIEHCGLACVAVSEHNELRVQVRNFLTTWERVSDTGCCAKAHDLFRNIRLLPPFGGRAVVGLPLSEIESLLNVGLHSLSLDDQIDQKCFRIFGSICLVKLVFRNPRFCCAPVELPVSERLELCPQCSSSCLRGNDCGRHALFHGLEIEVETVNSCSVNQWVRIPSSRTCPQAEQPATTTTHSTAQTAQHYSGGLSRAGGDPFRSK